MFRSRLFALLLLGGLCAQEVPERFAVVHRDSSAAVAKAIEFLCRHMPARDRETLSPSLLQDNALLAVRARVDVPWGRALPDELFDNYVLPYAQADEQRELWRRAMFTRCRPLVEGCETPGDAARVLNEKLFDLVNVHYSTERKAALQAPGESIEQGKATCTGLSILLADACRSVCVPARLVSVKWPHKRGNHTWVEIWDGKAWRFCGADEPDAMGFDRAWFVGDAKQCDVADKTKRIYAVSFAQTDTKFTPGWSNTELWGVDVTERYAPDDTGNEGDPGKYFAEALQDEALVEQMRRFYAADDARRATFEFDRNLDEELKTKDGDARLRKLAWRALKQHEDASLREDHEAHVVKAGGKTSPFTVKQVGEKPDGGWPLVIAMHGGGNAPKRVNDQQWRHMQIYYKDHPEVGGYLYCALRAPTDEWNGFYTDYFYPLLEKLIRQFVVCSDVNPDRVIAIGYSHGGYGAFAVGPKMPHRFAAVHASAAAPTDGESSPVGLHSLRFSFMVGGEDTAYGRRERCEKFAAELDELKEAHPGLYPTTFTLVEGNGHTGLPDRDLLKELVPVVRVATPTALFWTLTDVTVRDHYWLRVPDAKKGAKVHASVGDGVQVHSEVPVELWLDARIVDMSGPVAIENAAFEGDLEPAPSLRTLCRTMAVRGDPSLAASWVVEVPVSSVR